MSLYDAFISHASEDKDAFVRPLAHALRALHVEVWYDEFTLRVGDGLRQSIDAGLKRSRFAVLVLSPDFFRKQWPQRELDGLVAIEMRRGEKVLLPIWHNVTLDDVLEFSPPLANVVGIPSRLGVEAVAKMISDVVRPQGSPLVVARDMLLDFGITPPVVTDEYWLDVVEASNREPPWGFVSQREHWGRWSFPLPAEGPGAEARGERLGWTALQLTWTREAEAREITQITKPEEVLAFIRDQQGLADTCHDYPHFLATYAPQLTIRGFGGDFEDDFEKLLAPRCDETIALRHPTLGDYRPSSLTCQFVQGDLGGPPAQHYPRFEYLAWLLSASSDWLPSHIRKVLTEGFIGWRTWDWHESPSRDEDCFGLASYPERGSLFLRMFDAAEKHEPFVLDEASRTDLVRRMEDSRRIVALPESAEELAERFLQGGFIEGFIADRRKVNEGAAKPAKGGRGKKSK